MIGASLHLPPGFGKRSRAVLDRGGASWKLHRMAAGKMPAVPKFPDFLGIGAQKSGTTWLYENLKRHPQLFLPASKEQHFFDQRLYRSYASYGKCFAPAGERFAGEITPAYGVMDDDRVDLVHYLMPGVKLIMLLRNPIERSWSQAVMELSIRPGRPLQDVADHEFRAFLSSAPCRRRSDYTGMIERWSRRFPEHQIHIAFYDDLSLKPRKLLRNIFRFLEVSDPPAWSDFPLHLKVQPSSLVARQQTSEKTAMPTKILRFLIDQHKPEIEVLASRFPIPVESWRAQCDLL